MTDKYFAIIVVGFLMLIAFCAAMYAFKSIFGPPPTPYEMCVEKAYMLENTEQLTYLQTCAEKFSTRKE